MEAQHVAATKGLADIQRSSCAGSKSHEPEPDYSYPLQRLQRQIGNRAIGRTIQAKLHVSEPGDESELEADRIADRVMRMRDPVGHEPVFATSSPRRVQRICADCAEEETQKSVQSVQRKTADHASDELPDLEAGFANITDSGQPLDASTRTFFEPRFGRDFSDVRVHSGERAAESARSINALAYTIGRDIVFSANHYSPATNTGRRLLAHELAHVSQQENHQPRTIRRYTAAELTRCPCLTWWMPRMWAVARSMVTGGLFTGRFYASHFMERFLNEDTSDAFVPFGDFESNAGGRSALTTVNGRLANDFLAEADGLACGGSRSGVSKRAVESGYMTRGTDLFYAMGGFTLNASGTGTVRKNCDASSACTGIQAQMDIIYRVNDLYDWKTNPGGCTPTTGETGCPANTKTVTLPVWGTICDECLNRLVIHGWAAEFMVKVRGAANGYTVGGPCGFRDPTGGPSIQDNSRAEERSGYR